MSAMSIQDILISNDEWGAIGPIHIVTELC
jgi:hypothetical protein